MSSSSTGSKPSGMWQPPSLEDMQVMLPQYRFVSLLGRGGMGAVYKAVQNSLDRPVAIKVLPGDLIDDTDAQFAERFKNEARTMAKMNHPSIVNVFDFGETPTGLLFIVMEFVDGTDVAKMIAAQGRLPEDYALSITAHVCDALAYAHKNGVIHRDIKPANILINMEGAVKVADFGLAKQNDSGMSGLTKTNMAMGTPDFVAPEALIPGVPLDGRADLYAIGVMLYQMLTGEIPRGMWTMPGMKLGTDPRFDSIIGKAMQTDRECRYQTAADIRKDLDMILTTPRSLTQRQLAAVPSQSVQTAQQPVTQGSRQPQGQKPVEKPPTAPPSPKKLPMGLYAGVGAAAVVLIGGWWFMSPGKEAAKKSVQAPAANSATKPAKTTPKPETQPSSIPPKRQAIQTLDLLALTDPVKDRVPAPNFVGKNEWRREGTALVFQPDGKGGKLAAPVAFECSDYEIEFKAVKHSGNDRIHVDLPLKNGRMLPLVLNGLGRKPINEREGTAWGNTEREVHVSIRVVDAPGGSDRIVIQRLNVKGNPMADWSGDLEQHGKQGEPHPSFPGQRLASVFVFRDKYAVQTWTLRVFEGEAKVLRSSVAEKPAANTVSPPSPWAINLLAGLDVKRAADEGTWSLQNGELHGSGGTTGGTFLKLAFDREVPAEYDFRIQFTRVAGTNSITQHVVLPDGQNVMWMMGGFGNTVCAWEQVGGAPENKNPSTIKLSITNGQRYDCVVKVRKNRVQAELDGKLISDHNTKGVKLDVFARWRFPNPRHLGVGCQNEAVFHRVELIPVGETAVVAAAAPPAAAAPVTPPAMPPPSPPPSTPPAVANDPVSAKLADLEAKFQAAFERDAGAAYKAQIATLNTGYTAALDRELAAATKAGKLDDAVALREEKQRITDGKGLPPEDLDSLPEALKRLRGTWRSTESGYAKQRDAKGAPLFDAYDRMLDAYQKELTQQNKIDDALRVKTAREELVKRRGPVESPAADTPATTTAPKTTKTAPAGQESGSSWRKAAEWVLSIGGNLRIHRNGSGDTLVKDAKDLPSGRFDIRSMILEPPNGAGKQVTDDDLTRFNGMRDIDSFQCSHLTSITGSGFAAFAASAETMTKFIVYDSPIDPRHLPLIAQFKNLRLIELNRIETLPAESLAFIQSFKELTQLRLLGQMKLDDKAMMQFAGLTKLIDITLPGARITDDGLAALKGMKELASLELTDIKGITGRGLAHLAAASELTRLALNHTSVDDAALAHLSGCTKLRHIGLNQTAVTDDCMRHLGMLKSLNSLEIGAKGITGATLHQLANCKELTRLDLYERGAPDKTSVDDAGLKALAAAALPNLTDLSFAKGSTTEAGLAHLTGMKLTTLRTNEAPSLPCLQQIAKISTLEYLEFERGDLGDDGLAVIASLKSLRTFSSSASKITDAGLKVLQNMPALKTLILRNSQASEAGLEALKKARPDLKLSP